MNQIFADLLKSGITLFYPTVLCTLLILIALLQYHKRKGKPLLIIAVVYLYFSANGLLPALLAYPLEKSFQRITVSEIKKHNAMIVLGAGVNPYPNETNLSVIASARILEAARIYHVANKNNIPYTIFLTGGDVRKKKVSEADLYKNWLVQLGIPLKFIVTENKSENTYQNAKFTKRKLSIHKFNDVLLVTSALHMHRSLKLFQGFGINSTPAPSDYPYPHIGAVPLGYNLAIMHRVLHEYYGMAGIMVHNTLGLNQ